MFSMGSGLQSGIRPATVGIAILLCTFLLRPSSARAQEGPPRFEIGPVFEFTHQPDVEEVNIFQLGGRFEWNLGRHLGFEAEVTHSPFVTVNGGSYSGGHLTEGLFGVKYGTRWDRMGMFFKARPGFIDYSSASNGFAGAPLQLFPVSTRLMIPALNLAGSIEFYLSHHWMISADGGLTVGWYPQRTVPLGSPVAGAPAPTDTIRHNTTSSFQYSTAISYRFGREAYAPAQRQSETSASPAHSFWDKQNDWLFAGVAAARALDFASTLNKRRRGLHEGFLTDGIVDNHPEFAAIEAGGVAASIGVSYLFHRYGHHKIERGVSGVHIAATLIGAIANYATHSSCPPPGKDSGGVCEYPTP
jgi:hypothetical protein